MARVYLETSFISACVSTRTDVASVYRRRISRDWWRTQHEVHDLFVSAEVVRELSDPRYPSRDPALRWIEEVPLLPLTEEVVGLATLLVNERVAPHPVGGDAIHVAVATVHSVEYILSWNVRHLANRNKVQHLRTICVRAGLLPPQIVTPDLLWESDDESEG